MENMCGEKLKEGTEVISKLPECPFIGRIRGYNAELPVIGFMYIVEIESGSNFDQEKYPYSCITVPASYLKVVK